MFDNFFFFIFLCFPPVDIINFSRQLSSNNVLHEIGSRTSAIWHENFNQIAHQTTFAIDLECPYASGLLKEVGYNKEQTNTCPRDMNFSACVVIRRRQATTRTIDKIWDCTVIFFVTRDSYCWFNTWNHCIGHITKHFIKFI